MKRLLAAGVVAGIAGATTFGFAVPGSAQSDDDLPDFEILEATLEPTQSEPGDTITALPDEPCSFFEGGPTTGTLEWGVYPGHVGWNVLFDDTQPLLSGSVELDDEGFWEAGFEAPAYGADETGTPLDATSIPEPYEFYGGLFFEVTDHGAGMTGGRSATTGKTTEYVFKAICNPDLPEEPPTTETTAPTTTTEVDTPVPPPAVAIPKAPEFNG